jgi:hypothetical protein
MHFFTDLLLQQDNVSNFGYESIPKRVQDIVNMVDKSAGI